MKKETYPQSFRFVKSCSLAIVNRWRWKAAGGDERRFDCWLAGNENEVQDIGDPTRDEIDQGQRLRNLDKLSACSAEVFVDDDNLNCLFVHLLVN